MNKIIVFGILLTITQIAFGQKVLSKVDSLRSPADVEELIRSFNEDYKKFTLKPVADFVSDYRPNDPCKKTADSLNITKAFYKADLDNNGYTDLLAIGEYYGFQIFIVMNYGNNAFKLYRLTKRSFQDCTFPKIMNDTIIRYYYRPVPDRNVKNPGSTLEYKDLIFKYGDFLEYNVQPKDYSIKKIEYQTSLCFGSCPQFYISIAGDRSSIFKAEKFNRQEKNSKEVKGVFNTTLKDSSFAEIVALLNYIDFPNLKDNYEVDRTDNQSSILTITYNNGQVKRIRDYGLTGTFGLDRLYQLLFALRFNQDWK